MSRQQKICNFVQERLGTEMLKEWKDLSSNFTSDDSPILDKFLRNFFIYEMAKVEITASIISEAIDKFVPSSNTIS